jgi:hypothetical protein
MLQTTTELIDRRTTGPAQELTLRAPELARALTPGQAVLVNCGWGLEPYLRCTFYPIAVDDEIWTLRVPPGKALPCANGRPGLSAGCPAAGSSPSPADC